MSCVGRGLNLSVDPAEDVMPAEQIEGSPANDVVCTQDQQELFQYPFVLRTIACNILSFEIGQTWFALLLTAGQCLPLDSILSHMLSHSA